MKTFVLTALALLASVSVASAHGLVLKLEVAATVTVTVTFDDGDPADDCVVTVTATDGAVVAKGPTDKAGKYAFPRPAAGPYTVTADAGAGHLVKQTLMVAAEGEPPPATPQPDPKRSKTNVGAFVAIGCSLIAVFTAAAARRQRTKRA